MSEGESIDVAVVGSGFGGLATALRLAERGASVAVFERVNYPGGCASTHVRRGVPMASGATLMAGLAPGQLFATWLARHGVAVATEPLDPVLVQVTDEHRVPLPPDRARWATELSALPGVDPGAVERFLALQAKVAEPLWTLFSTPQLLPPLGPRALMAHGARLGRYAAVASVIGRTLGEVLDRCGLRSPAVRRLLDGLCQITVQVPCDEADAVFALGALQVFFGGAAHLPGGVGSLAEGLVEALRRAGGTVHFAHRVTALRPTPEGWSVTTNRGSWQAEQVVANTLPDQLMALTGQSTASLRRLDRRVRTSWGAAVVFATLHDHLDDPAGFHRQLVGATPVDGHSVWLSVSGRGEPGLPDGRRGLVASTHLPADADAQTVARVQQRIRHTLQQLAPDLHGAIDAHWTAGPRTFERFTARSSGRVGGVPRRRGAAAYLGLWPRPVLHRAWLVGDSVLYGQSALACAVSGHRVGDAVGNALGLSAG